LSGSLIKRVLDTNIYIDRFSNPKRHQEIFLSEGVVYLSAIVLMELKAGAHDPQGIKAIRSLRDFFKRANRIVSPTANDFDKAGEIMAKLRSESRYDLKKCYSLVNDILIALTAYQIGGVVYTQNKRDFEAIRKFLRFKVAYL